MKLEVVVLPVADVDRAKGFYKALGWREDAPDRKSYGSFASFNDPDGNGWCLQEITTRLPGR
jgi:catechol 2,3-dioxygenase-like lactoylglutathione lyase family enzyme